MIVKKIVVAIALLLGATTATLAQSAYTTGSAAGNAAAGYASPYGYGSGLYAYAPTYHVAIGRVWRRPSIWNYEGTLSEQHCKIIDAISHRCFYFDSDSTWPEGLSDYHGSNGN
jgi:hypothetical protein